MKRIRKLVVFAVCLSIILAISVSASAASDEMAIATPRSKDPHNGTTITLREHSGVKMRKTASANGEISHELYYGDQVYIIEWMYATADDYDWAKVYHQCSHDGQSYTGFSANVFLG